MMVSSCSYPEARESDRGSVASRSCSKKRAAQPKHIFTNVLTTVLCLVLSRVPTASAGIFPYENMELQVNGRRSRLGDLCPTGSIPPGWLACNSLSLSLSLSLFASAIIADVRGPSGWETNHLCLAEFHHLFALVVSCLRLQVSRMPFFSAQR